MCYNISLCPVFYIYPCVQCVIIHPSVQCVIYILVPCMLYISLCPVCYIYPCVQCVIIYPSVQCFMYIFMCPVYYICPCVQCVMYIYSCVQCTIYICPCVQCVLTSICPMYMYGWMMYMKTGLTAQNLLGCNFSPLLTNSQIIPSGISILNSFKLYHLNNQIFPSLRS